MIIGVTMWTTILEIKHDIIYRFSPLFPPDQELELSCMPFEMGYMIAFHMCVCRLAWAMEHMLFYLANPSLTHVTHQTRVHWAYRNCAPITSRETVWRGHMYLLGWSETNRCHVLQSVGRRESTPLTSWGYITAHFAHAVQNCGAV